MIVAALIGAVVAASLALLATSALPEGRILMNLGHSHGIVESDIPLAATVPIGALVVWRLSRPR